MVQGCFCLLWLCLCVCVCLFARLVCLSVQFYVFEKKKKGRENKELLCSMGRRPKEIHNFLQDGQPLVHFVIGLAPEVVRPRAQLRLQAFGLELRHRNSHTVLHVNDPKWLRIALGLEVAQVSLVEDEISLLPVLKERKNIRINTLPRGRRERGEGPCLHRRASQARPPCRFQTSRG